MILAKKRPKYLVEQIIIIAHRSDGYPEECEVVANNGGLIHGRPLKPKLGDHQLASKGLTSLTCYERERNVLFNDALNTFYLRLYGVRHMVKDHSDSEKGNPLPPHRLLFSIDSKGSFICTIPQTG